VNRSIAAVDFLTIQKNAVSIASNAGAELQGRAIGRKMECMALNPHVATPHGMTTHNPRGGEDSGPARKAEVVSEMSFLRSRLRKALHSLDDFHQALLALSLLLTRGGNVEAEGFAALKKRKARRGEGVSVVKMKFYAHLACAQEEISFESEKSLWFRDGTSVLCTTVPIFLASSGKIQIRSDDQQDNGRR